MIDHTAVLAALRVRLVTVVVATTGSITLSATASGYARTTGSFVADGFADGMEITPLGFASNPVAVILNVTALTITTSARSAESAGAGRSLSVNFPSKQAWENKVFTPTQGVPFFDDQYTRGPKGLDTIGPQGRITGEPMYLPRINVPIDTGNVAASRYADAFVNRFPPGDKIVLASGDVIEVRADQAPEAGQLLRGEPGFAGLLCRVPLRVRSINTI